MGTIEEYIEQTQAVSSLAELKDVFTRAIKKEGYDNFVLVSAKNNRVDHVTWSEFPDGYLDTYYSEKWDRIDPVLHFTQRAVAPFRWEDVVQKTHLTRRQKYFLHDCQKLGVHSGLTIPFHSPGNRVDLFSLSLRETNDINRRRVPIIYALAAQTWLRKSELTTSIDEEPIELSDREIECLKWCKEGKTYWEISQILHISERTVEFHLTNAMRKLGTNNRITAVVIAIYRGLLAV